MASSVPGTPLRKQRRTARRTARRAPRPVTPHRAAAIWLPIVVIAVTWIALVAILVRRRIARPAHTRHS
jgi:hypothetical protein